MLSMMTQRMLGNHRDKIIEISSSTLTNVKK
uniref:Uncharacterized protein n=1 Tax=Rhizophora mucronata TaxID=61149 RepID=A0A2P2R115_RHIMU